MNDDDFYEDDEPIEKIRADFAAGEKGVTVGRHDLNQRAAAIAAQMIASSEADDDDHASTARVEYDVSLLTAALDAPVYETEAVAKPRRKGVIRLPASV